jgi:uncharacterized membrane protein YphA (DoxX/SURF4 family)
VTLLHERWFIDSAPFPLTWEGVTDPGALAAAGIAVVMAAAAAVLSRRRNPDPMPGPLGLGASERSLSILYGSLPLILAVHLAVTLIVSGINVELFAPNLILREPGSMPLQSPFAVVAAVLQIGVALALFYGAFTRAAALALVALWAAGVVYFGPVLLLEQAIVPGIALTLLITGRGPFAVDALLSARRGRPRLRRLHQAITPLRVGTGISLATLAFTEKLWNLPLGLAFLAEYPVNFLPALGIPVDDRAFLLAAGLVELLAGLMLITNTYVRLGIVVLWLPFNLTLAAFGWKELVGHLPIYAAMGVLSIWGSGGPADVRALRRGLSQRPTLFEDPEPEDRDSDSLPAGIA